MNIVSKLFIIVFISIVLSGCASKTIIGDNMQEEPVISDCLPRYLSDPETRTIPEIFTGEEHTYNHLILRSQPNKRAGMYFFVMFGYAADEIAADCKFLLEVDSSDYPKVRKFEFTVPQNHSVTREVKLALTGDDWTNDKATVSAWRLTLYSPKNEIITQKQSWLWSAIDTQNKE